MKVRTEYDDLELAHYGQSSNRHMELRMRLLQKVGLRFTNEIYSVIRRTGGVAPRPEIEPPYVAVILNKAPHQVLRFTDAEWLTDECIAKVLLFL